MDDFELDGLARIYAAAQSLERGEENPVEAAQDIQRMAFNIKNGSTTFPWPFKPSDDFTSQS